MSLGELFISDCEIPKPLSKEETYRLFKRVNLGDEQAFKKIVSHNIRFVIYEVMHCFQYVLYDKSDLISIGTIGLMKAVRTFDVTENIDFATYAKKCIDNEILQFLRKLRNEKKHFGEVENFDDEKIEDETSILDEYIKIETCQIIHQMVMNLPARERVVIILYFGFDGDRKYTQQEIADMLHISQSYLSKLIVKILKKLRWQLEQEKIIEFKKERHLSFEKKEV